MYRKCFSCNMLHTPNFSGMIDGVGKRAKDVPVRLELDLKKKIVDLADFHDIEQKKLLSRLVRWFDRQPKLVQRLIVARLWTGTEAAVEQMIVGLLDDFRAGKLTPPLQQSELDHLEHGDALPKPSPIVEKPRAAPKKSKRRDTMSGSAR